MKASPIKPPQVTIKRSQTNIAIETRRALRLPGFAVLSLFHFSLAASAQSCPAHPPIATVKAERFYS